MMVKNFQVILEIIEIIIKKIFFHALCIHLMIIIKIVTFILIILIIYMICKSNIVKTNFLFFVASYGVNQLDFLYTQLKSFVLICESGYKIKIVVHHTHILKNSSFKSFYCFNIKGYIDINYIKISPMVKDYLTKEHRKYII